MQVTYRFHKSIAKRIALSLLLAVAAAAWQGCLMEPAGSEIRSTAADPGAGAKTLQEQPSIPANGVPPGCSRQWSSAIHDSVMYCPDIRPPNP